MKRILVPCNFSKPSEEALHTAVAIARKNNAKITVLYVMMAPTLYEGYVGDPMGMMIVPGVPDTRQHDAQQAFDKLKATLGKHTLDIEFEIHVGGLLECILNVSKKNQIDLVIMGTRGSSGLEEIVIGSNTERVVRFSKVPVLAIRGAQETDGIRNILLPTTGALDQTDFVNHVKELQKFFNAKLHVLLINTPLTFRSDVQGTEVLQDFAHHYKLENYELHFKSYFHEDQGIIDFANNTKMDLVVMGTHARKGLSHLFTGSITEDVVNHAHTSIWTYSLKN